MKGKRKLSGVLLMIAVLIIMQLPVSEADAATSASDFKMEGTTLVKYRGTEKNVSIPNTVEVIGESAFEDNDKIELVVIPKSVRRIEAYAFWSCDRLDEVVLGKGLKEVGDYAFTSCKGLKQMTIPKNVQAIGIQAFADCVNMRDITIPPEVTEIHETAFDGCAKLVIHCEEGSIADKYADVFYEKQSEMPEYEDVPEYSAPEEDENSGTGDEAAEDTENDIDNDAEISYENGNVLGSTQIVGNRAVVFIDNTSPVVHDGSAINADADKNDISEDLVLTQEECGNLSKYTIVDGKIVADQAYYRKKGIGDVMLPQGIVEIGQFAFARSTVTSVTIPEGTAKIGYGAFYHCDDLVEVKLPSTIEAVEPKAFTHSRWVENFVQSGTEDFLISGNVLVAYRGNGGSVTIPEGVSVIAGEVFAGNTDISTVIFPQSLRVIGEGAFEGCINLGTLQLDSQIEKIKDRAFAGCALSELILPASVQEIGLKAFDKTVALKFAGNQMPQETHELSAERLSNEAYRNVSEDSKTPGVTVSGEESAAAELEGAERSYTLFIEKMLNPSELETAYKRCFQKELPDDIIVYDLRLTDESRIPLTKLGKQCLTVMLPLSEIFAGENIKIITPDRNGQLEELDVERVTLDGADAVRFQTTHPALVGIYRDKSPLE